MIDSISKPQNTFLPNINLILKSLRISNERLNSRSKIAIDIRILRKLLTNLICYLPFDQKYYLSSNEDIAKAYESGDITNLHEHFIETGFFEGRFGAIPEVDESFYAARYNDIDPAIRRGDIISGTDHYIRSGSSEGRVPNEDIRAEAEYWASILGSE